MEEEIKNSIRNALLKGVSREEVIEILKNAGWPEEKINNTLLEIENEIGGEVQAPGEITREKVEREELTSGPFISKEEQPLSFPQEPPTLPQYPFQQPSYLGQVFSPPGPSAPSSIPFSPQTSARPLFDSQGRKICPYCGTPLKENAVYCPNCGRLVLEEIGMEEKYIDDKKGLAIASFVFGILGFIPIFAILGIIFGFIGKKSSKRGMAIAGIVLSFIFLAIEIVFALTLLGQANKAYKTAEGINEIAKIAEDKDSYSGLKEEKRVKEISKNIEELGIEKFAINVHPAGKEYCIEAEISKRPQKWYCIDSKEKKGKFLSSNPPCDVDYFKCQQ